MVLGFRGRVEMERVQSGLHFRTIIPATPWSRAGTGILKGSGYGPVRKEVSAIARVKNESSLSESG